MLEEVMYNASYSDVVITHWIQILKCHTGPHKYKLKIRSA